MVIKRAVFFLSILVLTIPASCEFPAGGDLQQKNRIELAKEAVSKTVLENGLISLVKECPSSGLVSIDVNVKAGSSLEDEYLGSGISHFVEHMVFKGTALRRPGDIEREIKSYGGAINGSVSQDLTNFHIVVPSQYFPNALAVLKDMLLSATFDNAEYEKEKEVILKEINLKFDEPQDLILRLLYETAYIDSPYRYPVIGYAGRLKSLKREDLIKYYERMYVPNRMVIAVAGDVDGASAISVIKKEFENFRAPYYKEVLRGREPAQITKRRLEKESEISLAYLALGFHSTSILDKDLFATDVLSMILGTGDDSRLNSELLKKKGLVYSIASVNYTTREPGLFIITAILDKGKVGPAEKGILSEIDKIKTGSIEDAELETAKRMVLGDYIFSRQTVEGQAGDISGNEILTGDHDFSRRYVEGIQAVTKDDVKRVAGIYLRQDNLTTITLVGPSPGGVIQEKATSLPGKEDAIKKEMLANGLTILLRKDDRTPTVSISAVFLGGLLVENENDNGISNLAARLLTKGTKTRKENEIRPAIERSGGKLGIFSGLNTFGVNAVVLKDSLDEALVIIKDVIANSVFPEDEIGKEKALVLAEMREEDDDIFQKGFNLLRKDLFATHPYGLRYIGEEKSVMSLTKEGLVDFYKRYCIPNSMVLSISGDIEMASLLNRLKELFGDMKRSEILPFPRMEARASKGESRVFKMAKAESLVLIGFKTVSIKDGDRYAFEVLGSVLSGYSGRLFSALRDKLSLAYSLGCAQKMGMDSGYLVLYVATTKDKVDETNRALEAQIEDIRSRTVGDDELDFAKKELAGAHKISMQTNDYFSLTSALNEIYGLGYDEIYKYEDGIRKVTKEDVKRIAVKYLDPKVLAEVTIIPE